MHDLSHRQQTIVELVHQQEYCSIDGLAQRFDVTTQTIRRDINELCNLGLARRHHGGVGLPTTLNNRSYASRSLTNLQEKQSIADRVVKAIPDGVTLFLGIGTTIACIAERLEHHKELRVVTNNLEAAHILSQFSHIETWIPGGRIRTNDRDIVDNGVADFFAQFSADIGIIGCAAVAELVISDLSLSSKHDSKPQEYVMEHKLSEAKVSQAIVAHSQQTWLVANNTKWQRKANTKVVPVSYFDRVFQSGKN